MVRVFSRMRWWCTDETRSSDGIGHRSLLESRSDSTMILAPLRIASETSDLISSSRRCRPSPPSATGNRPRTTWGTKPGMSPSSLTWTSLARSSLSMIGEDSAIWRQLAGRGSSRLPSGPIELPRLVTSSSRIASSGGLVTCAKSCEK